MSNISAEKVKALRDKTGAGMMDCKKALTESSGDIEKALLYLRKKGVDIAKKKHGRATSEGLIAVKARNNKSIILEIVSFALSPKPITLPKIINLSPSIKLERI